MRLIFASTKSQHINNNIEQINEDSNIQNSKYNEVF
jgi:hypothetical protein